MDSIMQAVDHYWNGAKVGFKNFLNDRKGMWEAVDIVRGLIAIIVTGAIGIYIAQQTVTTTGTPANANLSAMQTSLLGAGQTGASFVIILIIAFIGGIALSYMFGMFGGKRK